MHEWSPMMTTVTISKYMSSVVQLLEIKVKLIQTTSTFCSNTRPHAIHKQPLFACCFPIRAKTVILSVYCRETGI